MQADGVSLKLEALADPLEKGNRGFNRWRPEAPEPEHMGTCRHNRITIGWGERGRGAERKGAGSTRTV